MTQRFGLSESVCTRLAGVFAAQEGLERVVVYGSRAMGTMREGSDIDLALYGTLDFAEFQALLTRLDDLNLPWMIDASFVQDMNNPDLLDHISRCGIEFWRR